MTRLLYFAYGSNMSTQRLQARIPSARKHCIARLLQHQLVFHKIGMDGSGKCDVIFTNNHDDYVLGVVFTFEHHEKPILDQAEGPKYQHQTVTLLTEQQQKIDAFLYVVKDKAAHTDASLKPFCWYHHHVLYGAQQAGLPAHYIDSIRSVEFEKDSDGERIRREMAIYSQ